MERCFNPQKEKNGRYSSSPHLQRGSGKKNPVSFSFPLNPFPEAPLLTSTLSNMEVKNREKREKELMIKKGKNRNRERMNRRKSQREAGSWGGERRVENTWKKRVSWSRSRCACTLPIPFEEQVAPALLSPRAQSSSSLPSTTQLLLQTGLEW